MTRPECTIEPLRDGGERDMNTVDRGVTAILVGMVRLYQLILGPLLGGQCRFAPTCSAYAIEALRTHGPWRGSWLSMRRVLRCHPWGPCGDDPVPPVVAPSSLEVGPANDLRNAPPGATTRGSDDRQAQQRLHGPR